MNVWLSLICALFASMAVFLQGDIGAAYGKPEREAVFETLGSIADVHEKLTEKERTKEDMTALLEPYMDKNFAARYVEVNARPAENGWIFDSTDAPELAIPFFSYDNHTKINEAHGVYTVYEYVGHDKDGPVSFKDEYLTTTLKEIKGKMKVTDIGRSKIEPPGNEIPSEYPQKEKHVEDRAAEKAVFPLLPIDCNLLLTRIFQ
ncbi:DUF3993 domain-containing protein [Bacillus sonorensis]|uniref:DUF3993 domain-containing protein n=1 Tax=Bacillus sonorensis TaxID=119858 RepID=UPI001F2D8A20|nr:DUF3993 domain-containing protein [Bacillus sonorensis]MCF7619090.1 DUF3993 domain-containing protein [Bacillus sonorensis]